VAAPMRRTHLLAAAIAIALGACGDTPNNAPPAVQTVASDTDLQSQVRIAASDDDMLWLVWTEGTGTGQSIAAARVDESRRVSRWTISGGFSDQAFAPQIAMIAGKPFVAWEEQKGSTYKGFVATWTGTRWAVEKTIDAGAGLVLGPLTITPGGAGEGHLGWGERDKTGVVQLFESRRSAAGDWSPATVIRTTTGVVQGGTVPPVSLAVDSAGVPMAVWSEGFTTSNGETSWTIQAAHFDAGLGQWTSPDQIDAQPVAQVAACGFGQWVVVWRSAPSLSARGNLLARRFMSGEWREIVRIDSADDEDQLGQVLSSNGTALVVAWSASVVDTTAGRKLRAAGLDCVSGQWSSPALVNELSLEFPYLPRIAQDSAGRAAIAWATAEGPGSASIATDDGSTWGVPQLLEEGDVHGNFPDVATLPSGGWAAAWSRDHGGPHHEIVIRRIP
jgi:hypothetical protein